MGQVRKKEGSIQNEKADTDVSKAKNISEILLLDHIVSAHHYEFWCWLLLCDHIETTTSTVIAFASHYDTNL